jgi:hypothetical protein
MWYLLRHSDEFGLIFEVNAADGTEVNSGARAVAYDNSYAVFVPESEISAKTPGWRGAADSYDETYNPLNYFGNVTFSDPKRTPELVYADSSVNIYQISAVERYWMRGGYELCHSGGCLCDIEYNSEMGLQDYEFVETIPLPVAYRCGSSACGVDDQQCSCALFASLKWGWGNDDMPGVKYWDYAADADEWFKKDPRYTYACFCVKESK